MLVEEAALPRRAAESEVRRYTVSPGYQLCYLVGKLKIDALKADLRTAWAGSFSELRFHDLVLGAGCIPVELLRRFEAEERAAAAGSQGVHADSPHAEEDR